MSNIYNLKLNLSNGSILDAGSIEVPTGPAGSVTAISYANSNTQSMDILSNITLSGTTLTATRMNGSYGSATKHFYIQNGNFMNSSSNVGNASTPIYMNGGVFSACSSIHIDDGTLE